MNYKQKVLEDKQKHLKDQLGKIQREIVDLKGWLDAAKTIAAKKRVFQDTTEFLEKKARLRDLGARHQNILSQLSEVKALLKNEVRQQQIWQDKFVDIAKEVIDPDVFKQILDRAREGYSNQ